MQKIDSQIANMEAKFATDRKCWTQETKINEQRQNEKLQQIKDEYEKFTSKVSQAFTVNPGLFDIAQVSLKDLPFTRSQPDANEETFRWPTLEDLKALKLTEPLRLTEIRVKGENQGSLTAIQLVYQNGIERKPSV